MIRGVVKFPGVRKHSLYDQSTANFLGKLQKVFPTRRITNNSTAPNLNKLDVLRLVVEKTKNGKIKTSPEKLIFGKEFTDHMLEADWNVKNGWEPPKISPYHHLLIEPSASVLHYAVECFEGMKAYKDSAGRIRLFRPEKNYERFTNSSSRLALPTMDYEGFFGTLKELIKVDRDWIPSQKGYSLYIRPTMIGTQNTLGVGPSYSAKYFVICSPVGPYYPEGWKPVKLLADDVDVRAWPGGTGSFKLGANYAIGIKPQVEAAKKGYTQILWLFGPNQAVTEVGTMNMFLFWRNKKGEKELITAPLSDGTILPGVTRDSIIELAKQWNDFKVTERTYTIHEVIEALNEGRVFEAFGAGTAAVVSPVKVINFRGKDYEIPLDRSNPSAGIGPVAKRFADTIMQIQYGEINSQWSVVIDK